MYVCDKACGRLLVCQSKEETFYLVLTDMPTGRGRKGGKGPHTKKKGASVQTRTSLAKLGLASSSRVGSELRMPSHPPPLWVQAVLPPYPSSSYCVLSPEMWVSAMVVDRSITNLCNLRIICVSATRSGESFLLLVVQLHRQDLVTFTTTVIFRVFRLSAPTSHLTC